MTSSPGLCYFLQCPPVIQGKFRVYLSIITYVHVCWIYSILYINTHSEKLSISKAAFPGPAIRHQNDHNSKQHLLEFIGGIVWPLNATNGVQENI